MTLFVRFEKKDQKKELGPFAYVEITDDRVSADGQHIASRTGWGLWKVPSQGGTWVRRETGKE
jgi:hypothetical protein